MATEEQHNQDTPENEQQDWAEILGVTFADDPDTMQRVLTRLKDAA